MQPLKPQSNGHVGRRIALIAAEADAVLTELTVNGLTDADWECLPVGLRHLREVTDSLSEEFVRECDKRNREHAREVQELRRYDALGAA